jgi:transcriptional regulator with XRE-family HTH domain
MNRQICTSTDQEQWLINLKELKARTGMSPKQIAERENLSEKSVARVFSGESKNPGVDLIRRIIHALGGTWSEIFGESGAVIGGQDLVSLQTEVDRLTEENGILSSNLTIANLDIAMLKDKVAALESENKILGLKLEYEEKIIAVHNYYNKLNSNN